MRTLTLTITLAALLTADAQAAPTELLLEDVPISVGDLAPALLNAPLPPAPESIGELLGYDVEDAITAARVQLILARNLGADALRIEVLAQVDTVWLEGLVSLPEDRERAHDIAGRIVGVAEVSSYLEVDEETQAATPAAEVDNYILQCKLQLRLLTQLGVDALDFWIDVDGDVVTLSGHTMNRDAAELAERLLRSAPGVAALNERVVVQ